MTVAGALRLAGGASPAGLVDPCFRPPEEERRLLEGCVHASVLRRPAPLSPAERVALSDRLATEAAWALLGQLRPHWRVEDANARRRNQPGYDFLLDGRVRVQLKGGTFVESIGWTHKGPGRADLDFDVLLAVDLGVTLDGGVGRLANKGIPVKPHADFYVVPGEVVRAWVAEGRRVNARGTHIYMYKYPLRPGTRENLCQTPELAGWRCRFDVLTAALA